MQKELGLLVRVQFCFHRKKSGPLVQCKFFSIEKKIGIFEPGQKLGSLIQGKFFSIEKIFDLRSRAIFFYIKSRGLRPSDFFLFELMFCLHIKNQLWRQFQVIFLLISLHITNLDCALISYLYMME